MESRERAIVKSTVKEKLKKCDEHTAALRGSERASTVKCKEMEE